MPYKPAGWPPDPLPDSRHTVAGRSDTSRPAQWMNLRTATRPPDNPPAFSNCFPSATDWVTHPMVDNHRNRHQPQATENITQPHPDCVITAWKCPVNTLA